MKNKDAVRVLLVTGGHDHESSFYKVFEDHRDIRVNVDPHPVAFRNDLRKNYDVLVLYDTVQVGQLSEAHRKNLQNFVEAGNKGVVVLHHAIADFQSWEWWWKDVVGGRYILKPEPGYPQASTYLHDVELTVKPVKTGHPVIKGLPPMRLFDETYKNVWRNPAAQVLLTADHPTSDVDIAWISPYQKARVVYLQPGHGRETHELPWYRKLVHNAIIWSAGH
jgi:type 1 glutamine amidotransferase